MIPLRSSVRGPRHWLPAFFYLALVLMIGSYAGRQGLSEYLAANAITTGSLSKAREAVRVFEGDPNAQKSLGMIMLDYGNSKEAIGAFERAASIRDRDYELWMLLGTARYQGGDLAGAETAYRKSISLAPYYSKPKYLCGKLLLETDRKEEGFEILSSAAENNFSLYPEIVGLASTYYPDDPETVQRSASPKTNEARKFLARYFIARSMMTPETLSFLLGKELADWEKDEFVNELIGQHSFRLAHELWASKMVSERETSDDPIFDGGFEHTAGSDQNGFGWRIDQGITGVAVSRTQNDIHSGSYAIRFKFSGAVEIGRSVLSQLVYVRPGSKYLLKFSYRSPEMISAATPMVVVTDPTTGRELGRSTALTASGNRWTEMSVNFVSGQIPAVNVALLRPSCDSSPCPIFGELSLDDFSLVDR